MIPLWGKFIPEATSSRVAPKLKISAFVLILSYILTWLLVVEFEAYSNNSGAI